MDKPSTQNLMLLPNPSELQKLCRAISALEAIICPEWEYRYFSYQQDWSETEEFCGMRNGQGDQLLILFSQYGTCINGFALNSKLNGWKKTNTEQKTIWFKNLFGLKTKTQPDLVQDISSGILNGLPDEFRRFISGEPVKSVGTTFCIWQQKSESIWQTGDMNLPDDDYKDGSEELLQLLDGKPFTYKTWAEEYYDEEFADRELQLHLVENIYNGAIITPELVKAINPALLDFQHLKSELQEIGYHDKL